MARARVGNSGLTVKITLSFSEAAALHSLLQRVGPETNNAINDETLGLFGALDEVRDDVQEQDYRLWPITSLRFATRRSFLVDPEADTEVKD